MEEVRYLYFKQCISFKYIECLQKIRLHNLQYVHCNKMNSNTCTLKYRHSIALRKVLYTAYNQALYNFTGAETTIYGSMHNCPPPPPPPPEILLHYICNKHSKGYQYFCMHSVGRSNFYNCMFELDPLRHCLDCSVEQGSHSCVHIHSLLGL